jgi:uncharacterized BrkB/YihY/UPF0761 family membrane protein
MNRPATINRKRAFAKIIVIALLLAVTLAALAMTVDQDVLDTLKHSLSVWTIVALVLIINLVSFVCFVVFYAAYRWVRCDLKPRRDDDLDI